ncbi:hypothetical protein [Paenibacillus spiritus]|uniref:hypothetical protein n=1 Tax=Paenibacillus spiritus TaxID=2496557 RepID=UPI00168B6A6A|nr:hypothetical protein [Paenibacillus spiritus]
MGIVDQMKNILELLEAAKYDLEDWIDAVKDDENYSEEAKSDTAELVREICSVLYEVEA